MRRSIAGLVWWLTDRLPLPEAIEWTLSEWAYVELNRK